MGLEGVVNSLEGWCTVDKAHRLYELVKETNSQLTIELGVYAGRSFIPMAIAHRDKGSGFAIGIDAWKADACLQGTNSPLNDEYWRDKVNYHYVLNQCREAIIKYKLPDYCDTLQMTTEKAGIVIADNIIDILHQDGAHNVETIIKELQIWSPKLKIGGYWVIDDCDWIEAVDGYKHLPEYGMELMEDYQKWQIWKKIK